MNAPSNYVELDTFFHVSRKFSLQALILSLWHPPTYPPLNKKFPPKTKILWAHEIISNWRHFRISFNLHRITFFLLPTLRCSSKQRFSEDTLQDTGDTRWRSWLRHCATSRKVAGSIPDGVIGIFH